MSVNVLRILVAAFTFAFACSSTALAKDGDVEACSGKAKGDACTRADGDAGTCIPDASDPNVLKCDDDATGSGGSSSGSDDSGCSGSDGSTASTSDAPMAAAALFGLGALRRRRRAGSR